MPVPTRIHMERRIAEEAISQLLAQFISISVNDGGDVPLKQSHNPQEILAAMFSTEEDYLIVHGLDGTQLGWVHFVYGNDGWDVIADHTTNLAPYLTNAEALAEKFAS